MTALMPGVVLEDRPLTVGSNGLTYDYDPVALASGVPMLDVERNGQSCGGGCRYGQSVWTGHGQCGAAELCGAR